LNLVVEATSVMLWLKVLASEVCDITYEV